MRVSSHQVWLASASPRRQALLRQLGVQFRLLGVDVAECRLEGELPSEMVVRLALQKAHAGLRALGGESAIPVLGADTAVVLAGEVLGKPKGREDGLGMLEKLSGRHHEVYTGIAAITGQQSHHTVNVTRVTFRPVTLVERIAYWDSGEPEDKAGGYAIQGLGAVFVSRLEGSYSGVMGLPLFETAELLAHFGIDVLVSPSSGAGA